MFLILKERLRQGYNTSDFPLKEPILSDRFAGLPKIVATCKDGCNICLELCPTDAIRKSGDAIDIDLGRCIFCDLCAKECPEHIIKFTSQYRLSSNNRNALFISKEVENIGFQLNEKIQKIFGRSLHLRQVSAGGCNACEADLNVLGTPTYDLNRFGINFTASPRHADGIIVTGPISLNMKEALLETYNALSEPKIVIASGTCAISGGIFKNNDEVCCGLEDILPVDLYICGCPPHPYTALHAMLQLMGRI